MRTQERDGFAWLECLLILAVVALVLQLLPSSTWHWTLQMMNVRNWTASTWFCANALLFLGMLALRLGPELREAGSSLRSKLMRRSQSPKRLSEEEQKRQLAEQKALYERMNEARKKQII